MRNKKCGTKIWWEPSRTLSASIKRSVELALRVCKGPHQHFCSATFCSADLSVLALRVPEGPNQFCSSVFVLLTFLHLPITQCPRVPTNFCSTVFCSAFLLRSFCSASHPCVTFTLHNILFNQMMKLVLLYKVAWLTT